MTDATGVLTINVGSSGIKCAIFRAGDPPERVLAETARRDGAGAFIDWLERQPAFATVSAVGHRVVHGMRHFEPEIVTDQLLDELRAMSPIVPEHLPFEIALIDALRDRCPSLPQVACFDTAFHRDMPRVAKLLAIPRRLDAKGVQRYGFHGLSYEFLIEELARQAGPAAARGRVILAHLGGGASLAALRDGRSIDTSMGFTPASGLMMCTRSGDTDAGLVAYLARTEEMTAEQFERMANHESGLLGVSETSSDMRELLSREPADVRAAEAVTLFCYEARKWVGAFAAALGGVDTLVFSGGIGENAPAIRARTCDGLQFLGVELDVTANATGAPLISAPASRVAVRVIHTDEELVIARSVYRVLGRAA
ncbi:MAG: acetate/propionate family kinase [Gemmatimonadaceae bacterium]